MSRCGMLSQCRHACRQITCVLPVTGKNLDAVKISTARLLMDVPAVLRAVFETHRRLSRVMVTPATAFRGTRFCGFCCLSQEEAAQEEAVLGGVPEGAGRPDRGPESTSVWLRL